MSPPPRKRCNQNRLPLLAAHPRSIGAVYHSVEFLSTYGNDGGGAIAGGQGRPPLQRDVVPQGHLFRCAPLRDAVPYGRITHLPRLRVRIFRRDTWVPPYRENGFPQKQRGAPCGAPRVFRPCVAQTEEGYIRRFMQAGTALSTLIQEQHCTNRRSEQPCSRQR